MSSTSLASLESGSRTGQLIGAYIPLVALTTIAIGLRFWSRYLSKSRFWWDDWCALGAYLFFILLASLGLWSVYRSGVGRHIGHNSASQTRAVLLATYVGSIFYDVSLSLAKISAVLFFIRIFSLRNLYFKIAAFITLGLCIAWLIGSVVANSAQCIPAQKLWIPTTPGSCISSYALYLGVVIPNVVVDVIILLLPLPMLRTLQINKQRKVGLIIIFVFGYGVVVVSILRLVYIVHATPESFLDITWNLVPTLILVVVEPGVALICICAPSLLYLFRTGAKHIVSVASSVEIAGPQGQRMGPVANPVRTDDTKQQYTQIELRNSRTRLDRDDFP